jgi:hypothetical protein
MMDQVCENKIQIKKYPPIMGAGRPHRGGPAAFGGRPIFVGSIMDGYFFTRPPAFVHFLHHLGYT